MPSSKKNKSQNKAAAKKAAQTLRTVHAPQFRSLLLTAREDYAKGRSYDAVNLQRQALELGQEVFPRFDDHSLVKAHALVELGLATSAIMTDFASEHDEWTRVKQQMEEAFDEALKIFQLRQSDKTLAKFRKEECWIEGGQYQSPVPHTERLGPLDYLSCAHLATASQDPTNKTVQILNKAIQFGVGFQASRCAIQLQSGAYLQGEMPTHMIDQLRTTLTEHETVLAGKKTTEEAMAKLHAHNVDHAEFRHEGSRLGKMKNSDKKLVKDIDRKGLRGCENSECQNVERQPGQFSTCSRCKWVAYCSKQCQIGDWKRHKKECNTKATQKRADYKEQNKDKSSLKYGQSQQLLVIVRYLHHYATVSKEMASTQTVDAMRVNAMVRPKFKDLEIGQLQLGMQEVGLMWNAIWSMETNDRVTMIHRFVKEMEDYSHCFPSKNKGGPDFGVVADWGRYAVSGDFAIVKYTAKGAIFLNDSGSDIKAYLVVGITQSVESLLAALDSPLPLYVNTAILPFKGLVLCQGTIMPSIQSPSERLEAMMNAYVEGKVEMDILTSLV